MTVFYFTILIWSEKCYISLCYGYRMNFCGFYLNISLPVVLKRPMQFCLQTYVTEPIKGYMGDPGHQGPSGLPGPRGA